MKSKNRGSHSYSCVCTVACKYISCVLCAFTHLVLSEKALSNQRKNNLPRVYVHAHSPPHLCVKVFLYHVLECQPHPIPPPVEHIVTPSHEPAAEYTNLEGVRRGKV